MDLAILAQHYLARFKASHGGSATAVQWSALNAILGCRTEQYGELLLSCEDCAAPASRHRSCGHRSCNQCQNYSTTQWLERQQAKLLPVHYFMVTFTLPYELRALAKANQALVYGLLFVDDRPHGAIPGSAYWRHPMIGLMEPPDDRPNGATSGSA